jgi:uncharacterized protein (DUF486 family)
MNLVVLTVVLLTFSNAFMTVAWYASSGPASA